MLRRRRISLSGSALDNSVFKRSTARTPIGQRECPFRRNASSACQVGFLEDRDGNATLFSGPGGGQTLVGGINDKGYISGSYVESSDTHPFDGYVRAPDGTMTSFKGPSAVWTFAYNINKTGQTAGYYTLAGNLARAYVREPNGKLKTLLFDGATSTAASWINNNGTIAGYWFDTDNHSHGCLWLQQ